MSKVNTNQASEDELKELLETLDGPYGWMADIERLIKQHELEARSLYHMNKVTETAEQSLERIESDE
jgi:hypothetical protein